MKEQEHRSSRAKQGAKSREQVPSSSDRYPPYAFVVGTYRTCLLPTFNITYTVLIIIHSPTVGPQENVQPTSAFFRSARLRHLRIRLLISMTPWPRICYLDLRKPVASATSAAYGLEYLRILMWLLDTSLTEFIQLN